MPPRLNIDREKVEAFCRKWQITELSLFGSVLRDDFRDDSDVDVLVTFATGSPWRLFDLMHAEDELAQIIGRPVDLVEKEAVEESRNWLRRKHILRSAERYYVA